MSRPTSRAAIAAAFLTVLGACGLTDADPPQSARVVVDATPQLPLELVVSTDFVILFDELTGNQDPEFLAADTFAVAADFDRSYTLTPNDARIFVRLANDGDAVESLRIRVFLDGVVEYDVSANLGAGAFLEYLYRFNQPTVGG